MNWEQVADELNKPLERGAVKQRQQGTFKLSYIEGWHAIAEANRIFGHGNWDRETVEMLRCGEPYQNEKQHWVVNYVCRVRISVGSGARDTARDGSGFGSGIDRDLGRAHESAVKEAETDATKRALMTFGWPFGLALYDKTQEHVSDGETVAPPVLATGITPHEYKNLPGEASSARSHKDLAMLKEDLLKHKTPAAMSKWWHDHTDEIKQLNSDTRWTFFEEMVLRGLDACDKGMTMGMFWGAHEKWLNTLKKGNPDKFYSLEAYMAEKFEKLAHKAVETVNAG